MAEFDFLHHRFRLLACGALFWPQENAVLVADMHLEKGSAAAVAGWPLPPYDTLDTLDRLLAATQLTGASRVIALGDSFHDRDGYERLPVEATGRLQQLADLAELSWVAGNHEGVEGVPGGAHVELTVAGIRLCHEAEPDRPGPEISGHFHPCTTISLRTGRRVRRRCAALAGDRLVLPAYGAYAGGLDIGHPAFIRALGSVPQALIAAGNGLIRRAPHRPAPPVRKLAGKGLTI